MNLKIKLRALALATLLAIPVLCGTPAFAGANAPSSVPEIDPGSALGALTILVGGVLSLVDRRRAK